MPMQPRRRRSLTILVAAAVTAAAALVLSNNPENPPSPILRQGNLGSIGGTAYFTSVDGSVAVAKGAAPSPTQCSDNAAHNTDRTYHFTLIESALRCAAQGDTVVVDGQTTGGAQAIYHEKGFGTTIPIPQASVPTSYGIAATASTVKGSTTVTISAPNGAILAGMNAWGTKGILDGSLVTGNSGTSVVLDTPSDLTTTSVPVVFSRNTQIVGRCNADVGTGNLDFSKTSCKPMIQLTGPEWGTSTTTFGLWNSRYFLTIDNINFDDSNLGTNPDGSWDGTLCGCWTAGAISIYDGITDAAQANGNTPMASYIVIKNSTFRSIPFTAIGGANHSKNNTESKAAYGNDSDASKIAHLAITDNTFVNDALNWQTSESSRLLAAPGPGCTSNPSNCAWSHFHDLYLGISKVNLTRNSFINAAGGSLQIFSSDPGGVNHYDWTVTRNLWQRSGWPGKVNNNGNNVSTGSLQGNYVFQSHIENNIFANATNIYFWIYTSDINNNTIVLGSDGVAGILPNPIGNPFYLIGGSGNRLFNNAICYSRSLTNTAVDYLWGPGATPITANGQTGGSTSLSTNSNNLYGCASNLFTGYTPLSSPPNGSIVIDPTQLVPASSSAADGTGTSTGAPAVDFFGNVRSGAVDIGAIDNSATPPTTTTTIAGTTTTTTSTIPPTTTSTTIPAGCFTVEAESGTIGGGAALDTPNPGFSGNSGVGTFYDTSFDSMTVTPPSAGTYTVTYRFTASGSPISGARRHVLLNTVTSTVTFPTATPTAADYSPGTMILTSGAQTFRFYVDNGGGDWGGMSLDFVRFCPTSSPTSTTTTTTTIPGTCVATSFALTGSATPSPTPLFDHSEASVWTAAGSYPDTILVNTSGVVNASSFTIYFSPGRAAGLFTVDARSSTVAGSPGSTFIRLLARSGFSSSRQSISGCFTAPISGPAVQFRITMQRAEAGASGNIQIKEIGVL